MNGYNPLDPKQAIQQLVNFLGLLVAIGFCLHLIGEWLGPWLPVIIAISILSLIAKWVFRRRE